MKNAIQRTKVQKWLLSGRSLTPLQALRMGMGMRLSDHIHALRGRRNDNKYPGLDIVTDIVETKNGSRIAKYRLAS